MNKLILLATAAGAVLAAPAIAQQAATTTTTPQWIEIDDDNLMLGDWQITVDQAEDLDVTLADNTRVGEVEDILGTTATTPEAVLVELDNFAGLDDVQVVFPLADLAVAQGKLFTELTAEQIAALPRWDD